MRQTLPVVVVGAVVGGGAAAAVTGWVELHLKGCWNSVLNME